MIHTLKAPEAADPISTPVPVSIEYTPVLHTAITLTMAQFYPSVAHNTKTLIENSAILKFHYSQL